MRVIAGTAKGRTLLSVPGESTRPITDRVKSALFSILESQNAIQGSRWLDLFGGTGAVGIEALSRNAAQVVFVEKDGRAVQVIGQNLRSTGLGEGGRSHVVRGDAFGYLARPKLDPFDVIYIAPPQYLGLWKKALLAVDARPELFADNGQAIVQIFPKEYEADLVLANLVCYDDRQYGSTRLLFFELRSDARAGRRWCYAKSSITVDLPERTFLRRKVLSFLPLAPLPPILTRPGIQKCSAVANCNADSFAARTSKGLACVQGGQPAAPCAVPVIVQCEQNRIDTNLFQMQRIAADHVVVAGILEGDTILGRVKHQHFVVTIDHLLPNWAEAANRITRIRHVNLLTGSRRQFGQGHGRRGQRVAAAIAGPIPIKHAVQSHEDSCAIVGE